MTPLAFQFICLAFVIIMAVLAHTGKEPVKRPRLWFVLLVMNFAFAFFAVWDYIIEYAHAHPFIFFGYAAPAVVLLIGALFDGLTDHFAWLLPIALVALVPGINVILMAVIFGAISYDVITDPKYMWRGLKNRFNFTKE